MGNNDNRVVTWNALNSYITQNGGSPKKSSGANNLALKYGEFSEYAPIATATSSGVVLSSTYTGTGGGAYASNQLVIEKDVSWSTYETPVPTSIVVTPTSATLDIGSDPQYPNFVQLTATVTAPTGADTSITWTSSNSQIASVDNTGKVTAHMVGGPVTITAKTSNNLSDTSRITVIQTDAVTPTPQYNISWSGAHASVSGATSPVTLNEGSTWSGTFVADAGYEITSISTTGSNVTTNGNTVSVNDLLSNVTITVTTSQIVTPVTNYTITWSGDHASMTSMNPTISNGGQLAEGSSWTGTVVADNGYTVTNVTVNGSNATVNNNVLTISNLTGNVTITITTEQNAQDEDCYMTLLESYLPDDHISTPDGDIVYMHPGDGEISFRIRHIYGGQFTVTDHTLTMYKIDGPDGWAELYSAGTGVTIDQNGVAHGEPQQDEWPIRVRRLKYNFTDQPITLKYKAMCDAPNWEDGHSNILTVVIEPSTPLEVDDLTVAVGQEEDLIFRINGQLAYRASTPGTYVIADENIATIDEYGKVTGVSAGTTTITVTTDEYTGTILTDTATITVTQ